MNTPREETPEDGNQRRKSIGSAGGSGGGDSRLAGGKPRRYSIGITSSQKSIGEEGNILPNYLRASTGSCHDFCKFGKRYEHSKSSVPVKFKTTTIVNKHKFAKPVVPLERKKTNLKPSTNPDEIITPDEPVKVTKTVVLLPSKKPQVLKQSLVTNGKPIKNELKTVQRSTSLVKTSQLAVNRDANGGIMKAGIKTVKKTGLTSKTGHVKKVAPKASLNASQSPKDSFSRAASLKTTRYRGVKKVSPLKDQNRMQKPEPKQTVDDKVQTNLHGVEAEPEVKVDTMEFDFMQSSVESIKDAICNSSESFLGKKIVEQESITHQVYESSEVFSDKEVLEEGSLMTPPVSESSESFYDDEIVEGESEYTDDEEDEVEVSDGTETADVSEMETSVSNVNKPFNKIAQKGRMVISEEKDEKAVKLRFRRGKILDLQSENNGPKRLKFRRRVIEGSEDGQTTARRSYKNKTLDLQTEVNGQRKLKFTKVKLIAGDEDKQRVSKRSFERKHVEETKDSNNGPESVVLKHQGEQEKKDAQGLLNNVIEETASKLVESRKSKVKALVGAFETVISLQDGKPSST